MKTIIQFPHPGCEHDNRSGLKWNTGNHKRKYLKVEGSYLKDMESAPIKDKIYYWGEWEAPSNVISIAGNSSPLPQYIFEPYYTLPIPQGACNTDPFILGDQFYYCICKQGHYPSLRDLSTGSIILFGSNKNDHFVLDTLFVVKDSIEYETKNIDRLKSNYNETFYDVSLLPLNNIDSVEPKEINEDQKQISICIPKFGDDEDDYKPTCVKDNIYSNKPRIYRAIMYEERNNFEGMFSFSPCLPEPLGLQGFARPILNIPDISQGLTQGIKIINSENVKDVWNDIIQQILDKGLNFMIETDLLQNINNIKN